MVHEIKSGNKDICFLEGAMITVEGLLSLDKCTYFHGFVMIFVHGNFNFTFSKLDTCEYHVADKFSSVQILAYFSSLSKNFKINSSK